MVVLAVNFWDEERDTLLAFAKENKLQQRILLNGSAVGRDLYEVRGLPSSFWIDRSGRVIDSNSDFQNAANLDRKTRKLLSSP